MLSSSVSSLSVAVASPILASVSATIVTSIPLPSLLYGTMRVRIGQHQQQQRRRSLLQHQQQRRLLHVMQHQQHRSQRPVLSSHLSSSSSSLSASVQLQPRVRRFATTTTASGKKVMSKSRKTKSKSSKSQQQNEGDNAGGGEKDGGDDDGQQQSSRFHNHFSRATAAMFVDAASGGGEILGGGGGDGADAGGSSSISSGGVKQHRNNNQSSDDIADDTSVSNSSSSSSNNNSNNVDVDADADMDDNVDASQLLHTLAKVQELVGSASDFEIPKIVSIGNQSAGKSSVSSALLGFDIFPSGSNMVTRRPLELTLLRSAAGSAVYGQFGAYGNKIYDIDELSRQIARANMETTEGGSDGDDDAGDVVVSTVSTEPICLTISSPTVLPMVLVDLPGYIAVTKSGQCDDLPEQIESMCDAYVRDPNYIKLIVMSATVDRANSLALAKVKRAGQLHNSFGVLTKLDLVSDTKKIVDMLTDHDYCPGMGLVGLKMRSSIDVDNDMTIAQMLEHEHRYFVRNGLIVSNTDHDDDNDVADMSTTTTTTTITSSQLSNGNGIVDGVKLGVPFLQQSLSREHLRKTASSIPSLVHQLDSVIKRAESNRNLLSTLAKQPDLKVISQELGKILDDMSMWSPRRQTFELQLNSSLKKYITQAVNDSYYTVVHGSDGSSDSSSHSSSYSTASSYLRSRSFKKLDGDAGLMKLKHSKSSSTSSSLVPASESSYSSSSHLPSSSSSQTTSSATRHHVIDLHFQRLNVKKAKMSCQHTKHGKYNDYVIYGKCSASPHQFELDGIHDKAYSDVTGVMPFHRQTVNSSTASMRVAWNEQLEQVVDHLNDHQKLATRARQLCIDEIQKYVNGVANSKHRNSSGSSCSDSELIKMFFGYLVEKISERTANTQLIFSIEQALLREKRPCVSYEAMNAALFQRLSQYTHDHIMKSNWFELFAEDQPINVTMFSDTWQHAYYDTFIERVQLDIFRMLAVNLLDPLIFHCLNLSLTFFQGLNITDEERQMQLRVEELKAIRESLLKYRYLK